MKHFQEVSQSDLQSSKNPTGTLLVMAGLKFLQWESMEFLSFYIENNCFWRQ